MKNIVENQCIKTDKPLAMSYEALKAERDALAVENAALKESLESICNAYNEELTDLLDIAVKMAVKLQTPVTDAALAAIQANAILSAADELDRLASDMTSSLSASRFHGAAVHLRTMVDEIAQASKLREAK